MLNISVGAHQTIAEGECGAPSRLSIGPETAC